MRIVVIPITSPYIEYDGMTTRIVVIPITSPYIEYDGMKTM